MKPIKQLVMITLLLCMVAVMPSCANDPLGETERYDDTSVEMKVSLAISNMHQVTTRAVGDENTIDPNDVWMMMFGGIGNTLTRVEKLTVSASLVVQPIKMQVTQETCTFLIVANAGKALTDLDLPNQLNTITLANLKDRLRSPKLANTLSSNVRYVSDMPKTIFWAALVMDGITWKSALTDDGTIYGRPLALTRSIAKVSVRLTAPTAETKLLGATLFDVCLQGFAIKTGAPFPTEQEKVVYSKGTTWGGSTDFCLATSAGDGITPLYAYESSEAKVLIKARYKNGDYYYHLGLLDEAKNQLPLMPNYHYIVLIDAIEGYGYRTAEEAVNNTPSNNVKYEVDIDNGQDVVSNGNYYLSLDYSEYLICQASGAPKNVSLGYLYYKKPASFPARSEDVNLNSTGYVTLLSPVVGVNLSTLTSPQEIRVDFSSIRTDPVSINFILGCLHQSLVVYGIEMGRVDSYERYTLGTGFSQIALTETVNWAYLSHEETVVGAIAKPISGIADPTRKIYLYFSPNSTGVERTVYFTGVKAMADERLIHIGGRGFQNK